MSDKESALAFVERMEAHRRKDPTIALTFAEIDELLRLAKTAALIEGHQINIVHGPYMIEAVSSESGEWSEKSDLHTAVRSVADKIKEAK